MYIDSKGTSPLILNGVNTTGNVLIGTITDYGYKLSVASVNGIYVTGGSTSAHTPFLVQDGAGNTILKLRGDGNVFLSQVVYNSQSDGTPRQVYIGASSYLSGLSSIRASKKNIENVSNVDWLYQLNPVIFNYRKRDEEDNYTEETYEDLNYGLIAEDTQPVADFLINYDERNNEKKMIGIEYSRLITPMLKAIQEQQTLITALQEKLERNNIN
jgi:hypothetical protein